MDRARLITGPGRVDVAPDAGVASLDRRRIVAGEEDLPSTHVAVHAGERVEVTGVEEDGVPRRPPRAAASAVPPPARYAATSARTVAGSTAGMSPGGEHRGGRPVGAGLDVGPIVGLGRQVGFRVTVAGFRGAKATADRCPEAAAVRSTSPARIREAVDFDADTRVVVATHDFVEEPPDTPVPYVGLMGPRERFSAT